MGNLEKEIQKITKKQFDSVFKMDELKRKLIANLQGYLRERQDFIASIPTMDPTWSAPLDIIGDIIEPLIGDVRDKNGNRLEKCSNLFLLFDNILRSEDIRAGGLAFEVKIFKEGKEFNYNARYRISNGDIKYEIEQKDAYRSEFPLAVYLGVSGCQAFYGIIENILRNSGRHSDKDELKKVRSYSRSIQYKKSPGNDEKPLKIIIEFDYDGDNDFKDDFVKVKIYDNLLGWKQENNKWVKGEDREKVTLEEINTLLKPEKEEFGDKIRDGRIIDEFGNIVQGAWGFKEMRIAASFLRGLKISDYEKKDIEPPVISAICVPDKDDPEKGSLGFEFFIPKVKNLLIISREIFSNQQIKRDKLKNEGIYIEESINEISKLQQKGTFTHEFVAIDIDDEENIKYLENNILYLPYKLFFITGQENNFDAVFRLMKNIRYDLREKDSVSEKEKDNLKNLVISREDLESWLTSSSKKFELNGIEYECKSLSERAMLEIRKRWCIYLNREMKLPKVGLYYASKNWNKRLTFGALQSEKEDFIKESPDNILLVHRFDILSDILSKVKSREINMPRSIIPFAHTAAEPVTKIKQKIERKYYEQKEEDFQVLFPNYFNIVETGLVNIVIIDERVFNETQKSKSIYGKMINFGLNWWVQNVVIFDLDKRKEKFVLKRYNPDKGAVELMEFDKVLENASSFFPEYFKNRVHFMIIHQNIISPKIGGENGFKEFINAIPDEYRPWYVVVTSGRGHPPKDDMPENTKFLDFSNLRNFIVNSVNKFITVKILTQLKEKEGVT